MKDLVVMLREENRPLTHAAADRIEELEAVASTIRRHSHMGANVYAYQGHDIEKQPCPACLALIRAGILREDEVGVQSRGIVTNTAPAKPDEYGMDSSIKHERGRVIKAEPRP